MDKKLFSLIYEEISEITIKVDAYSFKFHKELKDDDKLICQFDTNDLNNKLITIEIEINDGDISKITTESSEKKRELTQEQFLANYPKEYQQFKTALKKYYQELLEKKYINKDKQPVFKQNNDGIPNINIFNDLMNKKEIDENIIKLKVKNIEFDFKPIETQDYKNLYKCTFEINNSKLENPIQKIKCLLKYRTQNTNILKITKNTQKINLQDFNTQYPEVMKKLNKAISIFEEIINRRNSK